MTERLGEGWSVDTLKKCRKFYQIYSANKIGATLSPQLTIEDSGYSVAQIQKTATSQKLDSAYPFTLSWSHYVVLMRMESADERRFYEIEAKNQNWSVRQLQRQYNSSLYERLALSKDKEAILRLAQEGQTINKPDDIIKNPLTLEFLGLKPDASYSETKFENAIIDKLQQFLLELGKGFLFEARQKRFTFDEENFFVDLVFYNRLLQCYVLIDLKVDKLAHQDLGQMQMYVHYYERELMNEGDNPPIGIVLCADKSESVVKYTLPENETQIFASKYKLYLPSEEELLRELNQEYQALEAGKTGEEKIGRMKEE